LPVLDGLGCTGHLRPSSEGKPRLVPEPKLFAGPCKLRLIVDAVAFSLNTLSSEQPGF
jgi:hypothetical protein